MHRTPFFTTSFGGKQPTEPKDTGIIALPLDAQAVNVAAGADIVAAVLQAMTIPNGSTVEIFNGSTLNASLGFAKANLLQIGADLGIYARTKLGAAPYPDWSEASKEATHWGVSSLFLTLTGDTGAGIPKVRPFRQFAHGSVQVQPTLFGTGAPNASLAIGRTQQTAGFRLPEPVDVVGLLNVYLLFQEVE